MIFRVRESIGRYKEFIVEDANSIIISDLLDEVEALDIVKQLISSAEDLLPLDYSEEMIELVRIREKL